MNTEIEVNGKKIKITLTSQQLKEIDSQINKKKLLIERIQTWEDILKEPEAKGFILPYKNPKTKRQKSINVFSKILLIVEIYNKGEILDWTNFNQYKWIPYKYFSGDSWFVDSYCWGSSLYFSGGFYYKSKQLSDDSLKKFRDIYEDFWM